MKTAWIAGALALAALGCKDQGKGTAPGAGSGEAAASGAPITGALPAVAAEEATMIPSGPPPEMVVIADADGALWINAAPSSWAKLSTADVRKGAQKVNAKIAHYAINEARMLGIDGERFMKDWEAGPTDMMLPPDDSAAGEEDPPPPEPEHEEEEEEDESGGTGTAMALEEGKMGKKDADRVEGQYKMKKNDADDAERDRRLKRMGGFAAGWGDDPTANWPLRRAEVFGDVIRDGDVTTDKGEPFSILLAAPAAKVAPLLEVLAEVEQVGVAVGDKVRVLRTAFLHHRYNDAESPGEGRWIEVRMWPVGLDVEAVPDVPHAVAWASGPLDGKALAAAYEQAIAARKLDKDYPVDVLVSDDVDMQHLVDVLVALDQAGANVIGLGTVPPKGDRQAGLRGKRIARAGLNLGAWSGEIDRQAVRSALAAEHGKVVACYDSLTATRPDAAGELAVELTIDKRGAAKAVARGIDPALEACVSGVLAKVKFPAPTAGAVQGNATYTMSN